MNINNFFTSLLFFKARENPEPIFDISDCNLKHVPNGIYSLCKVFRKKELKIMKNRLSSLSGGGMLSDLSLLIILDLSDNEFISLPSEINSLKLLEVRNYIFCYFKIHFTISIYLLFNFFRSFICTITI